MKITNLAQTDLAVIIDCFIRSFADYAIAMPSELTYWRQRFHIVRVDYSHSYGVFDDDQLVAFIIQGMDEDEGLLTAFNTGTGVLPAYRGKQLVDRMYDYGFPHLRAAGVQQARLEVLVNNDRAIRVYERVGFQIQRRLCCRHGRLTGLTEQTLQVKESDLDTIRSLFPTPAQRYGWDFTDAAMRVASEWYTSWTVSDATGQLIGYFIINTTDKKLAQIESIAPEHWSGVMAGLAQISPEIKCNNIDAKRTKLLDALELADIPLVIDQFEMDMPL